MHYLWQTYFHIATSVKIKTTVVIKRSQHTKLNWPRKNGPSSNLSRAFSKKSKAGPVEILKIKLIQHISKMRNPFNSKVLCPTSFFCRVSFEWSRYIFDECITVGKQFFSKLSFLRILQYFRDITLLGS